jgi:hypothetical protein
LAALSSRRSWSARSRWSLAIVVFCLVVGAMRLPSVDVSEAACRVRRARAARLRARARDAVRIPRTAVPSPAAWRVRCGRRSRPDVPAKPRRRAWAVCPAAACCVLR